MQYALSSLPGTTTTQQGSEGREQDRHDEGATFRCDRRSCTAAFPQRAAGAAEPPGRAARRHRPRSGWRAGGLYGCSSDSDGGGDSAPELRFQAVGGQPGADFNGIALPEGYTHDVLIPRGTPILGNFPAFKPDGSNTAAEQAQQSGEWHDGMAFFPIDGSDTNGLLCVNHESLGTDFFHGYRIEGREAVSNRGTGGEGLPINADQVRKNINGQAVSVVEIQRVAGKWQVVGSGRNRRITAATPMRFSGPAAGSPLLQTAHSPDGTQGRGILNNCGRGFTPWGTYLTCEENFRGHLTTREDPVPEEKDRHALSTAAPSRPTTRANSSA